MKLYKVKLVTANETAESITADYEGPNTSKEIIEGLIQAYKDVDGLEVIVSDGLVEDSYSLISWAKEDDEKIRDFVYQAEQDPFFGTYIDEREEFIADWESEEYSPSGVLSFQSENIKIIEESG